MFAVVLLILLFLMFGWWLVPMIGAAGIVVLILFAIALPFGIWMGISQGSKLRAFYDGKNQRTMTERERASYQSKYDMLVKKGKNETEAEFRWFCLDKGVVPTEHISW